MMPRSSFANAESGLTVRQKLNSLFANVATTDPAASDDDTQGYLAGSMWLNNAKGRTWVCLDSMAGAAKWMRVGGFNSYATGRWYGSNGVAGGVKAIVADTLYANHMKLDEMVTIAALGLQTSVGVASTSVYLGIYSDLNGNPGTLLAQLASPIATTAAAILSGTFTSNPVLGPGKYWLAMLGNGTPTIYGAGISATLNPHLEAVGAVQPSGAVGANSFPFGLTAAAPYSSGLPAAFPTPTVDSAAHPLIAWKAG